MHDAASRMLLSMLQQPVANTLWLADENTAEAIATISPSIDLTIISNRLDIAESASRASHHALFSDFDFSAIAPGSLQRIIYRVSKEKAVVHHVLNSAWPLLTNDGELIITGLKSDGIKTYIEKCKTKYGSGSAEKYGNAYIGRFCKSRNSVSLEQLDDQEYTCLRLIHTPTLDFFSKPGLFGWDKIDQGSAFLLEHLPDCLSQLPVAPQSMLDLGCGYGFLTLMTRHLPLTRRTAIDNNAAALQAIKKNAEHYCLDVEIFASDAGSSLSGAYDLILCNPPFHQGFSVDGCLTEKFLQNCRNLLSPHGLALFVVNAFIGLEKKAASKFSSVTQIANNQSFKLVMLRP
jgi:16S rRNA (guanine1207-N2)-methyltransferase